MSYRPTIWAARIRLEPQRVRDDLLRELQARGGNVEATARELNVGGWTLRRWIRDLNLADDLAMIRRTGK